MTARVALDITPYPHPTLLERATALARTLMAQFRNRQQTAKPMPPRPLTADEIALIANLSSMR